MTRIEYSTDEQLQQMHAEALHVLHNLRFWTKRWDEHFGCFAKKNKENWEKKADEMLDRFGLHEHNNRKPVIIYKSDTNENKIMQPVPHTETA
jgi:ABC-type uncharacterized transport system ATPase subunit